jgi:hypothetical protein
MKAIPHGPTAMTHWLKGSARGWYSRFHCCVLDTEVSGNGKMFLVCIMHSNVKEGEEERSGRFYFFNDLSARSRPSCVPSRAPSHVGS